MQKDPPAEPIEKLSRVRVLEAIILSTLSS